MPTIIPIVTATPFATSPMTARCARHREGATRDRGRACRSRASIWPLAATARRPSDSPSNGCASGEKGASQGAPMAARTTIAIKRTATQVAGWRAISASARFIPPASAGSRAGTPLLARASAACPSPRGAAGHKPRPRRTHPRASGCSTAACTSGRSRTRSSSLRMRSLSCRASECRRVAITSAG